LVLGGGTAYAVDVRITIHYDASGDRTAQASVLVQET